jgi:hypothetical protein
MGLQQRDPGRIIASDGNHCRQPLSHSPRAPPPGRDIYTSMLYTSTAKLPHADMDGEARARRQIEEKVAVTGRDTGPCHGGADEMGSPEVIQRHRRRFWRDLRRFVGRVRRPREDASVEGKGQGWR